ncbi:hypothetical protein E7735_16790 [Enterobacter cloacae]|nr:hypothetical protein E7735_16790 [Enterobacter cloacae]QCC97498.1 hypothetical protein E7739_16485 [Enterobacter cloacae]QCD10569.1 hypothetical protein E7729_08130 [Enterobacter cloacae]
MWLMKTLLTSGCTNQRGAGQRYRAIHGYIAMDYANISVGQFYNGTNTYLYSVSSSISVRG